MTDVFISYSRKDEPFVRRLHGELSKAGRDVWVDWEDIPLTADWWREIQGGIETANTFAFIISPDSARSEVCYREVDYAYQNHKRIVPIVCRAPSREEQAKMHPAINRHNWVFFDQEANFEANFKALLSALDTVSDLRSRTYAAAHTGERMGK